MAARDVLHFGCGTTQRSQAFGCASSYKHFYCFPKQLCLVHAGMSHAERLLV